MTETEGLGRFHKGWARSADLADPRSIVSARHNLFGGDFLFPVATISAPALNHNLETVARFCIDHDISLAPHAKVTMSPEIIGRQMEAGAWAMTVATTNQAQIVRAIGVSRILIAHQVIDPGAVRWVADELAADSSLDIVCLVDSIAGIELMERALAGREGGPPIDVLVELGIDGGRTGSRTIEGAAEVARRAIDSNSLRLIGTEGYEGVIHFDGNDFSEVDGFLRRLRQLTERLDAGGSFDHLDEIVVTAGGSLLPDRVVAELKDRWSLSKPVRLVIRPGCYVAHDSGFYESFGPFGVRSPMDDGPRLQVAMMVWAYVMSRPEPDLAVLGFGKRDASYDIDLPRPLVVRRDGEMRSLDGQLQVFLLDDQHAFVRVGAGFDLAVGDIVGCGISHPCTTFERWRAIPVVDADLDVVDVVHTFF
ncbi:MAG: alanine racemase [Acidimicrobiia bacterium]|nr:alanine racemase [Acidimicrobiia bacterium]